MGIVMSICRSWRKSSNDEGITQNLASRTKETNDEDAREYFHGDQVFVIEKNGQIKFGTVWELPHNKLWQPDEDDVEVILYPSGKKRIVGCEIGLIERFLQPGDVVTREGSQQRGRVHALKMCADVKVVGTKYIIKNVACERLKAISAWNYVLDIVLFEKWVGRIDYVEEIVVLKARNGAIITIPLAELRNFREKRSGHRHIPDSCEIFFPGNTVIGRVRRMNLVKLLTPDIRLPTNSWGRIKRCTYVVLSLTLAFADIHWLRRTFAEEKSDDVAMGELKRPTELISGEVISDAKRFPIIETPRHGMGYRKYLKFDKNDKLLEKIEWVEEQTLKFKHKLHKNDAVKPLADNVVWDGDDHGDDDVEEEEEVEDFSCLRSSPPIHVERLPKKSNISMSYSVPHYGRIKPVSRKARKLVRKKVKKRMLRPTCEPKQGDWLVAETLLLYRTATVLWEDGVLECNIPSAELCPILDFDAHKFLPRSFVLLDREDPSAPLRYGVVQTADTAGRTAHIKWFSPYVSPDKERPIANGETEASVYDLKSHPDFEFIPDCVVVRTGNFTGENVKSTVGQVVDISPIGIVKVRWIDGTITFNCPQDLYVMEDEDEDDSCWGTPSENSVIEESERMAVGRERDGAESEEGEDQEPAVYDDPTSITDTKKIDQDRFLVLPSAPAVHKFYKTHFEPDAPRTYFRAVQREQHLLKTSLPPGIWVRTYEDRSDLYSVMIEGPNSTPYEGGLFFFDIQLSREYPKKPPVFHYISYCTDRLNPNLYEEGKVCVSLLGTWSGRDAEVWRPESTLLQVIVSIQGLILVPEPYFNEPGLEVERGTMDGEQNSRMYNEMAISKTLQATLKMLSQPPEIFHIQIIEYFQNNGDDLCERVQQWSKINKPKTDQFAPRFPLLPPSRGFCLTIEGILGPLKAKIDDVKKIKLKAVD